MAQDNQDLLRKLKTAHEQLNWEIEEKRRAFIRKVYPIIIHWRGQLPNLRDIFRTEEIDWLLCTETYIRRDIGEDEYMIDEKCKNIVNFVARSGYKDEPAVDNDGKPLLRQTTALHHAARCKNYNIIPDLFQIYNRYDVNYTDETELTHFHVACMSRGCNDVVRGFLELRQDPNCIWTETGDSPLHLALTRRQNEVAKLLLISGANPNLANANGFTPLHIVCTGDSHTIDTGYEEREFVEMSNIICNIKNQTLQIDAQDKLGRTPLQLAVASFSPSMVDLLLDYDADLSKFVFPAESHFGKKLALGDTDSVGVTNFGSQWSSSLKLHMTSVILAVVQQLEKRGYQLDRTGTRTVMKYFFKYGLFQKAANHDKFWYNNKKFTKKAKKIMISPSLTLNDLVRLRPQVAEKLFTPTDCAEFSDSGKLFELPDRHREACALHLNEILVRTFFRRWLLDSFRTLTRYWLPILCCDMIIKELTNEDMYKICLAVTSQSS